MKNIKNKYVIIGDLIIILSFVFIIWLTIFTYLNSNKYNYIFFTHYGIADRIFYLFFLFLNCMCLPAYIYNKIRKKYKTYNNINITTKISYAFSVLSIIITPIAYFIFVFTNRYSLKTEMLDNLFNYSNTVKNVIVFILLPICLLIIIYSVICLIIFRKKRTTITLFYFKFSILLNIINLLNILFFNIIFIILITLINLIY